jgi:hypothetical protein
MEKGNFAYKDTKILPEGVSERSFSKQQAWWAQK